MSTTKLASLAFLSLFTLTSGCMVGDDRMFDTRRDLTGLDVAYLRSKANGGTEDSTSIDRQLVGAPFWFLPGAVMVWSSTDALYWGEVAPFSADNKTMVSALTGFEHTEVGGMGFGTLAYTWKQARWDADGSLESWEDRRGYGLGLLFQDAEWGNAEGTQGWSRSVLLGAFGYREIGAKRYLKLLWIPIPV